MKKLTPKQKKIANMADPKGQITGADFKTMRKGKAKPIMNRKKGM